MVNMSYCRFHNTLIDVDDCTEHLSEPLSKEEHEARQKFVQKCKEVVEVCYDEQGEPFGNWALEHDEVEGGDENEED